MPSLAIFAAVPLLVFLGLALLPRGRPAVQGIGTAAAIAVALTVAFAFLDDTGTGLAIGLVSGAAVALAATAQALRHALGSGRPGWLYPLVVIGVLVAGTFPILQSWGS